MKYLITLLSLCFSLSCLASMSAQQHYDELFERQDLLHNSYKGIYTSLTKIEQQEALRTWFRLFFTNDQHVKEFQTTEKSLKNHILGQDYRELLFYFSLTGQVKQAAQTLGLYAISAHTLIDNFVRDPNSVKWNSSLTSFYKDQHQPLNREAVARIESCFEEQFIAGDVGRHFDVANADLLKTTVKSCLKNEAWLNQLNENLFNLFIYNNYHGAPFPVSFLGHVGGNKVELHQEVPRSANHVLNLGEQLEAITQAQAPGMNKPYSQLTIDEFKVIMATAHFAIEGLFSDRKKVTVESSGDQPSREVTLQNTWNISSLDEMGFNFEDFYHDPKVGERTLGHPSFSQIGGQRLGIFGEMIQAIRDAKESVFIDIFWMGGSLGMNLAKELMKKTVENPDFTVMIITDDENKFSYSLELDMIYRYMRAYSEKFTHLNFYITPAQIGLKRTALPEFVDLLISNNVVDSLHSQQSINQFLEKDGFHLLAKSDHTKVMVVDGKNPTLGKAFVGSKNWTDSSGGVNFDEVAEIQGPAAALVLDSFYYDVLEAFRMDARSSSTISMVKMHAAAKYPKLKTHQAITKLLAAIDVTDRYTGSPRSVSYEPIGDTLIAPAQNNIYGTEMSAVEQDVQTILSAKKQILIDDQFLYDPQVVAALKHAIVKNKVEVYLMLEPLTSLIDENPVGAHIPNNLFLPELTSLGAQAKWKKTPSAMADAIREDHGRFNNHLLTTTFHLKAISVDGVSFHNQQTCQSEDKHVLDSMNQPILITGSANKDVMTMSGGFREYQVAIYDKETVATHDCLFWSRWNNPQSTESTDGLDFQLPEQALQLGITDKEKFLSVLRQLFFSPYNFTKDFL